MSSRRFGSQSLVRLLGHWQQASSRTPLWRQLADALRLLILDGRLALNTRLPGERELATAGVAGGIGGEQVKLQHRGAIVPEAQAHSKRWARITKNE